MTIRTAKGQKEACKKVIPEHSHFLLLLGTSSETKY